jgi:hypothetical protein
MVPIIHIFQMIKGTIFLVPRIRIL